MKLLFVGCGVTCETIKHYRSNGWTIIGITNQDVGQSIEDVIAEQQYSLENFPDVFWICFCPDIGQTAYIVSRSKHTRFSADGLFSSFRKPGHGMIELVTSEFLEGGMSLDSQYLMVGSSPEDQLCAAASGIDFLWAYQSRSCDRDSLLDAPYIITSLPQPRVEFHNMRFIRHSSPNNGQ